MIRVMQGGALAAPDLAAARVYDIVWPEPVAENTIGAGVGLLGLTRHIAGGRTMWTASGAPAPAWALHKGRPAVSLPPTAGAGLHSDASFLMPLTKPAEGELDPGAYFARVLFTIAMAAAGGDNQEDTGLYFGVRSVGVVNLPTISARAFGLARDGAGGWKFIATQAGGGALSINQAIAWPVAADEWCPGEFRLYPARKSQEARVELWLRGSFTLSYAWGAGTLLPDYSGVVNALGFALAARSRDMGAAASRALLLAGVRIIQSTAEDLG